MRKIGVAYEPRNDDIAQVIEKCARKVITFSECCEAIAAMGFKTTSVYEMVMAKEYELIERNK